MWFLKLYLNSEFKMAHSPTNRTMSEVCRLCASTDGKKLPIFGDVEDHEPLSYRILICVSVEVASDDVLSRLVCESCLDSVNNWFLFKQLCDSAQETQKKWLDQQSADASVLEEEVIVKTEPIEDEAHDEEQEPCDLEIKQEDLELSDGESQQGTASVLMAIDDPLCLSSLVQHHSLQPRPVKRERGTRANVENIDPEEIDKDIMDRVGLSTNNSAATPDNDIKLINHKRKGGVSLLLSKKNICPTCNKEFNTKNSLRRHILTHTGHTYVCKLCQQPYLSGSSLWRHMQAHKGVAPFKCSPCRIEFVGQAEFDVHRLTCTLLSPVKRKVIPVKSSASDIPLKINGKSLKTVSLKSKRKTFNCTLCTKFFFSKINLTNHIKTHQTRCRYCHRDFKNRAGFQNHMKTHASKIKDGKRVKRYLCKFCPKVLSQWNLAVKHKQSHLDLQALDDMPTLKPKTESTVKKKNIKPYNCLDCSETFVYWKQYMKHKEMHTVNTIGSPRRYTCTICKEQFKGWYSLARHRSVHESNASSTSVVKHNTAVESKLPSLEEKTVLNPIAVARKSNNKCNICDREFKNATILERHLSTHSKAKNFSCHVCGIRMKYASSVQQHLKSVHNVVYQYSLIKPDVRNDDSEGENITMPTLKKESGAIVPRPSSETSSRTYSCPVCSKQFSTKSLMTSHHQIIHKGATVYRCKHCPQMYRQQSTLVRHESTHLKAESELSEIPSMFTCEGCPLTFDNADARDLHQRKENHNVMDIKIKIYSCTLCQNSYITELALHSHRFKKHGVSTPLLIPNTIHTCYICHKSFKNHVAVRRHLRTNHLKVEREGETVVNEPSTSTSTSSNNVSNNNTCNICDKRFKNICSLTSHLGWHTRTTYTSPSVLHHTKKVDSVAENHEVLDINDVDENTCKICSKSFQNTKAFKIHTAWHIRRREFERTSSNPCSVCGKSFASVKAFKIHTAWHSRQQKVKNENPSTNESNFCEKTNRDSKLRKIDEACHAHTPSNSTTNTDVEKKVAEKNTRGTSSDIKLSNVTRVAPKKHKLVGKSKEECKNICSICLLAFPTTSALQSHIGWHNRKNGDATRECTYCHKKFSSVSNVHRHKKICRRIDTNAAVALSKKAVQVSGQMANKNIKQDSGNTTQSSSSLPAKQSSQNALTCDVCSKQFIYQRSFHNHQRLHINNPAVEPESETVAVVPKPVATSKAPILVKSWQCDLCPQAFLGQKALAIHRNMHLRKLAISSTNKAAAPKPMQVASLTCNVCKKVFSTSSGLSRHRQLHIREIFSSGTIAKVKRKFKKKKVQAKVVEETVLNNSHDTSA